MFFTLLNVTQRNVTLNRIHNPYINFIQIIEEISKYNKKIKITLHNVVRQIINI